MKSTKNLENGSKLALRRHKFTKICNFRGLFGVPRTEAILVGVEYRSSYNNFEKIGLVNHKHELRLLQKQFSEYHILKMLKRCNEPIQEDMNDFCIWGSEICEY